jgi:chromosome segregation ATPase
LQRTQEKATDFEARIEAANQKAAKAEQSLAKKETERQAAQSELDDLLMVFADVEDKSSRYKERLKALGESVSDAEDDEADADEAESDEVD